MRNDGDDAENVIRSQALIEVGDAASQVQSMTSSWFRLRLKPLLKSSFALGDRSKKSRFFSKGNDSDMPSDSRTLDGTSGRMRKDKSRDGFVYLDNGSSIRAGSHRLAIALQWRMIENGTSVKEAAASSSINGVAPDLFVRNRRTPQAGFAARASGLSQGFLAGATAFKDGQREDWIAAFELNQPTSPSNIAQAWWIVGFRDGLIVDDKLVFDEVTAQSALEERTATASWERVIAPGSWNLPYVQPSKLEELISVKAASRLRSLSPLRAYALPLGFAALLVALMGGGYLFWYTLQQEELRLLEMQQRRMEEERIAKLQTPPWVGMPTVEEFISVCGIAIERNILFSPGWNLGEFECGLNEGRVFLNTTWSDVGGRAAWLLATAHEQNVRLTLDAGLQTANVSEELVFTSRKEDQIQPLSGDILDRTLALRFDTLSLDVSLSPVQARSAPTSAAEQGAPIWNYHELTFRTSGSLEEYLSLLADIPAIVPMKLRYNIEVHEWSLGLRIYHPPIGAAQ